jgi:threonine dehydrogenase-like Zn-dependent dehydrogenase
MVGGLMRAVVARDKQLFVGDVSEPKPDEAGDVLVQLRACGICGSDLHTLQHAEHLADVAASMGMDGALDPHADFYLGHEWVAEVLDLGPGTQDSPVQPGDAVVSMPYLMRGDSLVPLGFTNDQYAGFCEQFLLSAPFCVPVPNGLDHRRAALTEPMAVGLHTINKSGIAPGDAAIVVGCGPIGLALIAWLVARGIEPIVASDLSPVRRALATQLGAHEVVDPGEEPPVDAWRRVDGFRPLVLFEAVGVPGMIDDAIFAVPSQTRVVVAGVCMQPDSFRPLIAVIKEINLQFVYAYDEQEFAGTLRAIAEGEVDVAPLITGTVGFDGVAAAFKTLGTPNKHVKILVEPSGPADVQAVTVG